jgi:hypothetical protein
VTFIGKGPFITADNVTMCHYTNTAISGTWRFEKDKGQLRIA